MMFKGELTLQDILYGMPYKMIIELRNVRLERLKKDQEEMEREAKERESKQIRSRIIS